MAKRPARSSSTHRSSPKESGTRRNSRPSKMPSGPKQRACDLRTGSPESASQKGPVSAADEDIGNQRLSRPTKGHLLPAGAALLSLVGLALPWQHTWSAALVFHPSKYAPWLDSPMMLGVVPVIGLLSALTALTTWWWSRHNNEATARHTRQIAWTWALGITALSGLALTAYYNESLNLSPFAGIMDQFWGIPLVVPAAVAGGVLLTWNPHQGDDWIAAKGLLTWSSTLLLVAALVPTYEFGQRHLLLTAILVRMGKGGAQSLAGLSALVMWAAAAVGLWLTLRFKAQTSSRAVGQQASTSSAGSRKKSKAARSGRKVAQRNQSRANTRNSEANGPIERLAPVLGWVLVLTPALSSLAAALSSQTGIRWFLGPVPPGADTTNHLTATTGSALAALTAAWSLALAWTVPKLAQRWTKRHGEPGNQTQRQTPGTTLALWTGPVAFWSAAFLLAVAFLVLELQAVGFTVTDENIYYYQAMLVAQGKLPYRDFFFAHPPLHILIPALFFRLFGFHLFLAKAISIFAGLGSGLMLLLTAKRLGGNLTALVAGLLYLFAFAVLNASINLTGMNLTVFFLMTGVFLLISGRPGWGGLAVGAALSTGFYSAAAAATLLVAALLRSRTFGLRFSLGLFGMWGGVNLLFWAMSGSPFLDGVYRYHGRKIAQDPRYLSYSQSPVRALFYNIYVLLTGREFKKTMFYHAHLFVPWAVAAAAWIAVRTKKLDQGFCGPQPAHPFPKWLPRWTTRLLATPSHAVREAETFAEASGKTGSRQSKLPDRGRGSIAPRGLAGRLSSFGDKLWSDAGLAVLWLTGLALVVEFSMFRRLYSFYFVLWYPFMALSAAWLLVTLLKNLARTSSSAPVFLSACLLWVASLHPTLAAWGGSVHKGELRRKGERIDYAWRKAGALDAATPIVKALFWRGYRLRAEPAESVHQFLWNKKRHFDEAPAIARYIQNNTRSDQTIAGASAVTPLLAILAHRHIAAEIVDTNTNRFRAGLITEQDFYRRICQTKLAYLVSAPMSFFSWHKMRFYPRFLERFTLDHTFLARSVRFRGVFPIRLLKNVSAATSPPYCRLLSPFHASNSRRPKSQ